MQLLDLNGDGASDLLFGPGIGHALGGDPLRRPPYDHLLPTGKFLGGSHSLWLSQRDASGQILPLSQGLSLARDEEPLATANYGHVRLDEATASISTATAKPSWWPRSTISVHTNECGSEPASDSTTAALPT